MVYVIQVCWQLASRIRTSCDLILLASCMTYTIVVCTVKNSWWWTEELSETCRVSYGVLLTVHLSTFISVISQLDAQNVCSTISLFHASTCFEHMYETATYRCDNTKGYVIQFWRPDDEHMCSKHVEAWNKLTVNKNLCIKLVKYWDKCRVLFQK